jgi:predicted nuclease of predicted toxin-antitoxin system
VKLLLDENLSRKLVHRLADLFPDSIHVSAIGMLQSGDTAIWDRAKEGGYILVTADADFYELAMTYGPPPKVIWLRSCDYPTSSAERLIRSNAIRVAEFVTDDQQAVLILAR